MSIRIGLASALLSLLACGVSLPSRAETAAEPAPSQTDLLARQEQLRSQVEAIFADLARPPARDETLDPLFTWITGRLLALGPEVAPLMAAELDAKSRVTLNVAAYVLGFLHPEGAKQALVGAAEAADREGGEFGRDRLVWLAYALGLSGDADAVDLLDKGRLNCIRKEFMVESSILEVTAVLTAPASRARLLAKLERYARSEDPELRSRLYVVLDALRQVADPSLSEALLPFLKHPESYVRASAARALGATSDPAVVDPLLAALEDSDTFARFAAASTLESLKPQGRSKEIEARLQVENYAPVRGSLYRTLAAVEGEAAVPILARCADRPNALERVFLADALGMTHSKKALNLLREALRDPDARVPLHAMGALAAIGSPGAVDTLLALLQDPRWPVEAQAIQLLVQLGEKRAAPRIAERLKPSLEGPVSDAEDRDPLIVRGNALVSLRATDLLAEVRRSAEIQTDPAVVDYMRSLERRMTALNDRRDDVGKWSEAAASDSAELRQLAYGRLAELGGPGAVQALLDSFGRVSVNEGVQILRALSTLASPAAAPLIERVLLDPSFDARERAPLRSNAAWAARRLGGPGMAEALRKSALRRDGRDVDVLVYLALLEGKNAVPLLESLRIPRMRWFDWSRGPEQRRLDGIVSDLKAGRSLASLNVPPEAPQN